MYPSCMARTHSRCSIHACGTNESHNRVRAEGTDLPQSELLGPFPRPHRHAPVNGCPCLLSRSFFAEFSSPGTCILSDAVLALRAPPTLGLALSWGVAAPWDGGAGKAGAAGDSNSVSSGTRSSGHLSEELAGGKMTKTSGRFVTFTLC